MSYFSDSNSFKLQHFVYLAIIGVLTLVGVLFKENAIVIMVSSHYNYDVTWDSKQLSFQPTLAVIDFIRNSKRLQKKLLPKTLILRLFTLTLLSIAILTFRLKIQNFESPTFRREDNPVASADDSLTRNLTQNYLYVLNFFLLIAPDWLCFDWSFDSIELISSFNDFRVVFIVIFYIFVTTAIIEGLKRK